MAVQASIRVDPKEFARIDRLLEAVSPKKNKRIWKIGLERIASDLQEIVSRDESIIRRAGRGPAILGKLTNRHGGTGLLGSFEMDLRKIPKSVAVTTDRVYAPVHEDGLTVTIPAHTRESVKGKRHKVRAHRARFPKRPFLKPALDKGQPKLVPIMIQVINEEMRRV